MNDDGQVSNRKDEISQKIRQMSRLDAVLRSDAWRVKPVLGSLASSILIA
jgi:hypothetical protein